MSAAGWLGFALSTFALMLNAHHRRTAQAVFIGGNLMWLVYAGSHELPEMLASQLVYLVLNIRTLRAWINEHKQEAQS